MLTKQLIPATLFFIFSTQLFGQSNRPVYSPFTTTANRAKLYASIKWSINNLSVQLNDSSEDKWMAAFNAIELIYDKSPWESARIHYAFDSINCRSIAFQRALLEMVYTIYPNQFSKEIDKLAEATLNEKIFAMSAEYLVRMHHDSMVASKFISLAKAKFNPGHPIIRSLLYTLERQPFKSNAFLKDIINENYLRGNIVMYSIQRKNRDYPGIVLIKDSLGKFIRDSTGIVFNVPQLGRSLSNLPGYLTNGSTPQGVFRMDGFDVSQSAFIGPTTNIQLTMPWETTLQHFMKDSSILDSIWSEKWYGRLLPISAKEYFPLYGSYFAGMAGRTEIISHGTTVDPQFYHARTYFPLTPTEGCLCTKELWNEKDGKRVVSDQEKLVTALRKAGGAQGYCVVVELDDKQEPVTIKELASYFNE